jgi:hypothetical protein
MECSVPLGKPEGRGRLGKPRWKDNIEMDLK